MNETPLLVRPSLGDAVRFWAKLGWISFGGPSGQIAIMHEELVEKRRWISEERFLHALNFCMLLPGPEAQQLAVYIGWLLHGTWGGVIAGTLFVLPAALILWGLSWLFMVGGSVPWVAAIFYGLQPAVMAIVAAAVIRIGSKALRNGFMAAIATLAFVALFVFKTPFGLIIAGAAALGIVGGLIRPDLFPATGESTEESKQPPRPGRSLKVVSTCLLLWWLPVIVAGLVWGWDSILAQEGLFFSKAALITFGGAYAVLPYVAQQAVETHGWLTMSQMISGLGLAETTPGPLIMVLQFVGFVGAWRQPPLGIPPLLAGTMGAALTTWVTFLPSFLFVLTLAPYVEKMRHVKALTAALSTITAAVVGVILNLAVWFGMHVLIPAPGRIDIFALIVAIVFFVGLWLWRWNVVAVVAAGALLGLIAKTIFPT